VGLLAPHSLLAAGGDLDCTFGLSGTILHDLGSIEAAHDAQLQSDGKIVTIGSAAGAIRLSRFLDDGSLDPTFGSGGTIVHVFAGLGGAETLAVDSLDRIVVGGTVSVPVGASSDQEVFVARFTTDGAVDTAFGGGDGWTSFDFTSATANAGTEGGAIVLVDSSDRPIVGGSPDPNGPIFNPSDRNLAVARLDTNGALDTSFDGDGISIASSAGAVDDTLRGMALDALGRIVAIGSTAPAAVVLSDTILARWTTTGALDTTFDTDGVLTLDLSESGSFDSGIDVGFDSTGAIIALGIAPMPALARLTDTGALDPGFAGDGILQQSFLGTQDVTEHVRIQSDDKILVTGWPVQGSFHFAAMRFTSAGALDPTWSDDGVLTTALGFNERAYAAILQADEKLLLLGGADNDTQMVMVRYLNDAHPNGPLTTTVILSDSPDPSLVGETVTVSYSVTATTGTPAGSVIVSDSSAGTSCTGTVASGSCDLAWPITPGERTVSATFVGGGGFCSSSTTDTHTVLVPTLTWFAFFAPTPSVTGEPVTVGVQVIPLNVGGVGPVTGTVTIDDGAGASCAGVLVGGATSCQLTPTVAGTRNWTATYLLQGHFAASARTASRSVAPASTTTTITADTPDPSAAFQAFEVQVAVDAMAPGSGTPTGSVEITDGAGASCVASLAGATGSCMLTPTIAGTRSLGATYAGDGNFSTSSDAEPHQIDGTDFGDAPAPYPVTLADDGARHAFGSLFLGSSLDADADGQPSLDALGDDQVGADDEDGVSFAGPLLAGGSVDVTVVASAPGVLDAWIDFGQDGSWLEAGDRIATAVPLVAGTNTLSVAVPAAAELGSSFGRFRISSLGVTGPTGSAADGEVEDHAVALIDGVPPQVMAVTDLLGSTIDGCTTTGSAPTDLRVTFDESVQGADLVDNYLVLAAGPDADLSTTSCGAVLDDDVALTISAVSSDLDPMTPTFTLELEGAVPTGLARLIVCDSIEDLGGLALDGDGNGLGGDPSVTTFRVDPGNLFANGHFDDCPVSLTPWIAVTTPPNTIVASTNEDGDDASASGSAHILSASTDPSILAQCVETQPLVSRVDLEFVARLDPLGAATASLDVACEFFDLPACSGAVGGTGTAMAPLPDLMGDWERFGFSFDVPTTTTSALCSVAILADDAGAPDFDAYLDQLSLHESPIFADGFESADTGAWSSAVGESVLPESSGSRDEAQR
jgi:uncharacterized delta-60 repeat protein